MELMVAAAAGLVRLMVGLWPVGVAVAVLAVFAVVVVVVVVAAAAVAVAVVADPVGVAGAVVVAIAVAAAVGVAAAAAVAGTWCSSRHSLVQRSGSCVQHWRWCCRRSHRWGPWFGLRGIWFRNPLPRFSGVNFWKVTRIIFSPPLHQK